MHKLFSWILQHFSFFKKKMNFQFSSSGFSFNVLQRVFFLLKETVIWTSIFVVYFDHNRKLQLVEKENFVNFFRKFVGSKFVKHVISSLLMLVVLGFFDQKFPNWISNFWSVWHLKDWAWPRIQVVMSRRGCENLHNQLGNVKNYMLLLNYVSYLMVR